MTGRVEKFASTLDPVTRTSVRAATAVKVAGRIAALPKLFADPEEARTSAAKIKSHVLDNLRDLLLQLEAKCVESGIHVHWARDAESANQTILDICRRAAPDGCDVVKGKSMASEEIHLNRHLEKAGFHPVETDLGEFVVQIDGDSPSHIVMPILHKNRTQVAESFEREGLGPYTEQPEELTAQARRHLRSKFREAPIGVSGVNFAVASTGRLVIVENEGNNRLCTTAPSVHIAIMGIEKVIPTEADLALFLPLLTASATGQLISTYVHFIQGPRAEADRDGPGEVHLVLLDNGRSRILSGPYCDILRCIRCGACLNVCPVYREASGHAYRHVYSGPLGAVLAPALEGVEKMGDLAKASSLCGACEEVCPVKIPIPHMLLRLRDEVHRKGADPQDSTWKKFEKAADSGFVWRAGMKLLPMAMKLKNPLAESWLANRELPKRAGRSFRKWWNARP